MYPLKTTYPRVVLLSFFDCLVNAYERVTPCASIRRDKSIDFPVRTLRNRICLGRVTTERLDNICAFVFTVHFLPMEIYSINISASDKKCLGLMLHVFSATKLTSKVVTNWFSPCRRMVFGDADRRVCPFVVLVMMDNGKYRETTCKCLQPD